MVDLYSVASYNIYSVACYGGLIRLLCVTHVGADWLMCRLCRGTHSGWICMHQSCVLGSCANIVLACLCTQIYYITVTYVLIFVFTSWLIWPMALSANVIGLHLCHCCWHQYLCRALWLHGWWQWVHMWHIYWHTSPIDAHQVIWAVVIYVAYLLLTHILQ